MKSQDQIFQLPLESKTGTGNWLLFIGGAAFFSFLGYKVCAEAFEKQPFNLFVLLLGVAAFGFALCSLLAPWFYYRIIIHQDYIELIQFGGLRKQIVWRRELVSYELLNKKAKYSSWEVLKLYTRNDHYAINSQMYANFFNLRFELTAGLPQTYNEENRAKARAERSERYVVYLYWVVTIGGLCWFGARAFTGMAGDRALALRAEYQADFWLFALMMGVMALFYRWRSGEKA